MTWIASSSMLSRSSGVGHLSPRTCSLSASPVPTPSPKRPPKSSWVVAAACATISGWMRIVGAVTAVETRIRSVTCAMAPSTDQTNGLWPWLSSHGWKWSEIQAASKPARSAREAARDQPLPGCSSLDKK